MLADPQLTCPEEPLALGWFDYPGRDGALEFFAPGAGQGDLADFLENAGVALHSLAADGTLLWANQAELTMLGYTREEYLGHPIAEFHADQDVIADILRRLARHETLHDYEARLRCKDGSLKYVLIDSNVLWENGRFVHTRCCTHDITRCKQAQVEAESALRERDQFLSIARHELKTPITTLLGYVQILHRRSLREGSLSEHDLHALEVIADQTRRLNGLIETLFNAQWSQIGRLTIARQPLDLCALARELVEELQPALERHRLQLACGAEPLVILGDPARIEEVLRNLLQNAIKYSPEGGPVGITLARVGERASLAVSDQGIGIPQAALAKLFQCFYRASNVTLHQIAGMGIGLYVIREIVTRHGGSIEVASTEGVGSTFTVYLPLAGLEAPAA